jgi:hypothetical protein
MTLPEQITIGDKYGPAMQMTDQAEADAYFTVLVEHCMRFGKTAEEATAIERSNLGYYAGYYNDETRARVERLFACAHPIFGPISAGRPTLGEALEAGWRAAAGSA